MQTDFGDSSTCRHRRQLRNPPHVIDLAAQAKGAQTEGDRLVARQCLWEARKQLADTRRMERLVAHVRKGKVVARSQQLKPLTGVSESIAGNICVLSDPAECMRLIGDEYKRKWKADDAQRNENLSSFVNQLGREPISISHAEARQAFARLKNQGAGG